MAATGTEASALSVRADYLRGDPSQDGPITRGRLELEPAGLRFSAPGAPDLRIALGDMEGLTVSGRSPYQHPRRSVRGTMFVAARCNGTVDVWEFALEREAGATLRDRINRELHARRLRRPPLPFVEQLVGPIAPSEDAPGAAANGHPAKGGEPSLLRPRMVLLALAIAAAMAAEIVIAVSLIS
jgi:hypothetical protein